MKRKQFESSWRALGLSSTPGNTQHQCRSNTCRHAGKPVNMNSWWAAGSTQWPPGGALVGFITGCQQSLDVRKKFLSYEREATFSGVCVASTRRFSWKSKTGSAGLEKVWSLVQQIREKKTPSPSTEPVFLTEAASGSSTGHSACGWQLRLHPLWLLGFFTNLAK